MDMQQDPSFCYIQEIYFKDKHYLRVKGWERIYQANRPKKQADVAIPISNKIDFKPKLIKRDGKRHFILTKGKIH